MPEDMMYCGALTAIVVFSVLLQGFALGTLCAIASTLAALAGIGALLGLREAGFRLDPIPLVLIALALWLIASAWASPVPAVAGVALYQQLVLPLAVFACACAREPGRLWRNLTRAAAVLAILLPALALLEPLYRAEPTFSSFFISRNSLSAYAILLICMVLPRVIETGPGARWPWALGLWSSLFIICFSTSRAALAALLIAGIGLYASAGRDFRRGPGKLVLALALWAFLLADLALEGDVVQSLGSLNEVSANLMRGLPGGGTRDAEYLMSSSSIRASKIASANERFLIWRGTWKLLDDAPWQGFGPGTFRVVYPAYSLRADHSARSYAHNDALQIGVELGLPGLFLGAALGAAALQQWWRFRRREPVSSPSRVAADCLFWGMGAVAAHSLFDYNFYVPPTLILFGCILARFDRLTRLAMPGWRWVPAQHFAGPSYAIVIIGLSALPLLSLGSAALMSRAFESAIADLAAGRLEQAEKNLDRAARFSASDRIGIARAQLFLAAFDATADAGRRLEFLARARNHLEQAARMNPYTPEVPYTELLIAAREPTLGDHDRAAAMSAAYNEALRRDGRYYPVRLELARYLAPQYPAHARALLEGGLGQPFPRHPLVLEYLATLKDLRASTGDIAGSEEAARELTRLRARFEGRS